MSMADKRDRTSYWLNNTVKNHLNKNGCILTRKSKQEKNLFIYQIIDHRSKVLSELNRVALEYEWRKDRLQSIIDKKSNF